MSETKKPVTNDRIVEAHQKIRAEKLAFAKLAEEITEGYDVKLKKLETLLLSRLNEQKTKSFQTAGCTVYKQVDIQPIASDWDTIYRWIEENQAWGMLERRLTKTFVVDYMTANKGLKPPGVSTISKVVAKVRRNPAKKEKAYNG